MATTHSKIAGNKSVSVTIYPEGHALVYEQAINPKTGKGWQARRNIRRFESKQPAMVAWLKSK